MLRARPCVFHIKDVYYSTLTSTDDKLVGCLPALACFFCMYSHTLTSSLLAYLSRLPVLISYNITKLINLQCFICFLSYDLVALTQISNNQYWIKLLSHTSVSKYYKSCVYFLSILCLQDKLCDNTFEQVFIFITSLTTALVSTGKMM